MAKIKTALVILASAVFWRSDALPDNASVLPDLGAGNPRLLVWMNPNLIQFDILAYIGTKGLPEYNLYTNDIGYASLKLVYPSDPGAIVALSLQHCYPFGNGQGFLRTVKQSTRNVPRKNGSGMECEVTIEPSDIILFEEQNGSLITRVLDDATVRKRFDLKPGCRFLGELDGIVFYWSQRDEDVIFGRDTKADKVHRWKVPGVYIVEGVLRGIEKDYGFVVWRRIHRFTNATGEEAAIEVFSKDAVVTGAQDIETR